MEPSGKQAGTLGGDRIIGRDMLSDSADDAILGSMATPVTQTKTLKTH